MLTMTTNCKTQCLKLCHGNSCLQGKQEDDLYILYLTFDRLSITFLETYRDKILHAVHHVSILRIGVAEIV